MGGHSDEDCKPPKPSGNALTDFKLQNVAFALFRMVDGPVTYFKENVVQPLQAKNTEKWYHRRFNRVPTVDQCEIGDAVCVYEADQQYYRDNDNKKNAPFISKKKGWWVMFKLQVQFQKLQKCLLRQELLNITKKFIMNSNMKELERKGRARKTTNDEDEAIVKFHEENRKVDSNIVQFLRQRMLECIAWEGPDFRVKCSKIQNDYEDAATNWFIKYGDIRTHRGATEAYMKQKHRLIWERRNPDKKLH